MRRPGSAGAGAVGESAAVSYVLPLKWQDDGGLPELTAYLRWLASRAEVIVVDGSPETLFARHARSWSAHVRHLRPDADLDFLNGKVNGAITGVRRARHERVILADDDVRYDADTLGATVGLLADAELVRPQNYFDPLPWHARWDTARALLNRSVGADYPGTFGLRRSAFLAIGGYDGDVLFENLELIRTVRAHGGRERRAPEVLIRRLPPDARRFWSQRVRQAYDDLAQPWRLALFLSVLPALGLSAGHRARLLAVTAAGSVGLAEAGRRRAGGRSVFPVSASLFAPCWLLERSVCSWLALGVWLTGRGVRYAGKRVRLAAHSRRVLARKALAVPGGFDATRRPEPAPFVRAVAERFES